MKRMLTIVALLGAALGIAQVVPSAGATALKTISTKDITFQEGYCSDAGAHCKQLEVGGDPSAFGTRIIFTIPIYSAGTTIGYEQGECVNLNKKSLLNYCTYNLNFPADRWPYRAPFRTRSASSREPFRSREARGSTKERTAI